jgi:hypothetical protein
MVGKKVTASDNQEDIGGYRIPRFRYKILYLKTFAGGRRCCMAAAAAAEERVRLCPAARQRPGDAFIKTQNSLFDICLCMPDFL